MTWDAPAARVREGDADQHHATVAVGPGERAFVTFVASAWIVGAPLGADGPEAAVRPFGEATGHHPQIAARGDELWLVGSAAEGLHAGVFGWDGAPRAAGALAEGRAMHADLAAGHGGGLVVWAQWPDGIHGWRAGEGLLDGAPTPPIPLAWDGAGTPAVRPTDDGWLAVWAERRPGVSGIRSVLLDPSGAPRGPSEEVESWRTYDDDARPGLAVGPAGHAVAWRRPSSGEAWLRVRDPEGALVADVALHDGGPAGRPALDAAGDTLFAAWERRDGERWRVVLRAFDLATGDPLGPEVTAARDTGVPGRPAIAVTATDAGVRGVVSWEALASGGRRAVWIRSFRTEPPAP